MKIKAGSFLNIYYICFIVLQHLLSFISDKRFEKSIPISSSTWMKRESMSSIHFSTYQVILIIQSAIPSGGLLRLPDHVVFLLH